MECKKMIFDIIGDRMRYKKMIFDIPVGWDINKCFTKIEDGKIIIDHPVDHNVFERCTSPLLDGDNYQIEELEC